MSTRSPKPQSFAVGLAAAAALAISLLLLRGETAMQMGVSSTMLGMVSIWRGILYDLLGPLLGLAAAYLGMSTIGRPGRWLFAVVAVGLFGPTLANTLYLSYFGGPLEWWVVSLHTGDLPMLAEAILDLVTWPIVLSGAAFASALVLCGFWQPLPRPLASWHRGRRQLVRMAVLVGLVLFAGLQLRFVVPGYHHEPLRRSVAYEWYRQWASSSRSDLEWALRGSVLSDSQLRSLKRPVADVMTDFKALPLKRSPQSARVWRERLGLPQDGPIHVVLLFSESMRAQEVFHPEYGEKVFPRLHAIAAKHGITYRQTYSTAATAGQTVRGLFSTLCSTLPNVTGPAVIRVTPGIDAACAQSVFGDAGFRTAWLHGGRATFHNQLSFEISQGTEHILARNHFIDTPDPNPVKGMSTELAVSDLPFLRRAASELQTLASMGDRPIFAHVLTLSGHVPHGYVSHIDQPTELYDNIADKGYVDTLSTWRYVDEALGTFFDHFFDQPMADRTVIALIADHSTKVGVPEPSDPIRDTERRFRVPMYLFSKNLPRPSVVHEPVHQMDVLPTLAEIAAVSVPDTWLGRSLAGGVGSPWVSQLNKAVSFRVQGTACYDVGGVQRCYTIPPGVDPLFAGEKALTPTKVPAQLDALLRDTVVATRAAFLSNRIDGLQLYRRAAESGDERAQYRLAEIYRTGDRVEIDLELATEWYRKAARQGHKAAMERLADLAPSKQ